MNFKRTAFLFLTSAAMMTVNACTESDDSSDNPPNSVIEDSDLQTVPVFNPLSEDLKPYALPACRQKTDKKMTEQDWADANNTFALNLLRLDDYTKSSVISPYSVERAFGMLYEGACSDSADEIRTVMSMPESDNSAEISKNVEKIMLNVKGDAKLTIDNRVWVDKRFNIHDNYANTLKSIYGAPIVPLDFENAAENSRQTINHHISDVTHERIEEILSKGSVSSQTKLVLTNAVYFKDNWKYDFKTDCTHKQDFTTASGKVQIDTMCNEIHYPYYETENAQIVGMPYENNDYMFLVVLPKLDDGADVTKALQNVESSLTAESMRKIITNLNSDTLISLFIPKFKIHWGGSIREQLQKLGMKAVFSPLTADLSAISAEKSHSGLFVSDVMHKAFIEITEKGTEAAAATSLSVAGEGMGPKPKKILVNVDHPFMYTIIDTKSGAALFMGRVVNF